MWVDSRHHLARCSRFLETSTYDRCEKRDTTQGFGIDTHEAGCVTGAWLGAGVDVMQDADSILSNIKSFIVLIHGSSGHLSRALRCLPRGSPLL